MLLRSIVLSTLIWSVMSGLFTGECGSPHNDKNHRNRHKFKRRHLFSGEIGGKVRHQRDNPLPQLDPSSLEADDVADDDDVIEGDFELDKPLPVEQVAVPVGGKAYLPCDTRSPNQDLGAEPAAGNSSGFFMVMWFREQKETDLDYDQNYGRQSSASSASGEPIFTYDTRQSSTKISNPPKWWSSSSGFGDRAYFHSSNGERPLLDPDQLVDHLTVDRAKATDTGIYRCRVDFLKSPTRNRLVNLTVIVAPDRPKIYAEYKNDVGGDRQENYPQVPENIIAIDEGTQTLTLVCRVIGGWPRPRLTWYHENTVLDSTYQLLTDDDVDYRQSYRKHGHRDQSTAGARVTINRLELTNLTRWHPIMSQRLQTVTGAARLTCQASNSIANAVNSGDFRPTVAVGTGTLPPPATTEHAVIRLNLKPTDVQIISVRQNENNLKVNENLTLDKNEVLASKDSNGNTKYTIRAGQMYRVECQSKGSRPPANIEWYLLKKNQRYNVAQSINRTNTINTIPPMIQLGEKSGSTSMMVEGTIASVVETQQATAASTDKDEMLVTTSILSFMLKEPKSAIADENDDDVSILVCRTYNPVIKILHKHHVETKIALDMQYPPIVELRFGNRMLDTGQIGPGDDVYFECVARANPSTTIRYSWYHNGVRLTQDAEKKRTDDGDKRGEKKNSRLANRVIQYSQLGSLVLQSIKVGAAGNYACQATNGIDINSDTDNNKTISNIVRLYVKHVPVCKHHEDILISTKKSDALTGPLIRCRAGRGHPPAIEYRWTFYPQQITEKETFNGASLEPNEMTFAGRSARDLDSLLAETAVQSPDGGISYTFTTSTPVLKSYLTAVKAAASVSSNAAHPNFLRGRLECQAVNSMGTQKTPCVYRISDTIVNQGSKDLPEIVDCLPIPKKEQSGKLLNETNSCGANIEGIIGQTNWKTRFCIMCKLNTSSLHFHQRFNYVLQLFKITRGEVLETAEIKYNVTGFTMPDNIGISKTNSNELDDDDYYIDLEENISNENKGGFNHDGRKGVQKLLFVIDDRVVPDIYRGRIYNNDGDTISAVIKGIINVLEEGFDKINENDFSNNYIINDMKDKTNESTMFGYAWSRVTVTLAEMFSMVMPSSSSSSERHREQQQQQQPRHKYWHTASVTVTAALIAVVVALSCGICVVVAVLFRRRYDDYRANRGHNIMYGLGYGDGDEDIGESAAKTTTTGQRKTETAQPTRNGLKIQCVTACGTQDGEPIRMSRKAEYAVNNSSDNYHAEANVPLLQQRRLGCKKNERNTTESPLSSTIPLTTRYEENANTANVVGTTKNPAVIDCSNNSGPDIVMSTAVPMKIAEKSNDNWPTKQKIKMNSMNSNHQQPSRRLEYQKPIHHSGSTVAAVSTNKLTKPATCRPAVSKLSSTPSSVVLSKLHRESSI